MNIFLPNITYGKTFFSNTLGAFDFTSNAYIVIMKQTDIKFFSSMILNWIV